MLASLGFISAAVLFGIFSWTFKSIVIKKTGLKLDQFAYAFGFVGAAFLVWGLACAFGSVTAIQKSVIVGDELLLAATVLLIDLAFRSNRYRSAIVVGSSIGALGLIWLRTMHYFPQASLSGGILYFNTQRPVELLLSALIVLVWLPICLVVAGQVASRVTIDKISTLFATAYVAVLFIALIFIEAKRRSVIIATFLGLLICFALLLSTNFIVKYGLEEGRGRKKSR
jgi:hypothetical protein